jgi:hypothetical protein
MYIRTVKAKGKKYAQVVGSFLNRQRVSHGVLQTFASLSAIYSVSGGLPRVVNSLATNCLIYACQQGERYVDEECVYQAANELQV